MCVCNPIEQDGYRYVQWVGHLGACVYSPRDQIAFWLGMANIFLWLFAQAPQIYANYKRQTVEAISGLFLLSWLLGDATNLIGCILTEQLPTQLYTAIYFIFIDMIMLTQYAYYKGCKRDRDYFLTEAQLVDYAGDSSPPLQKKSGKSDTLRQFSFVIFLGLGSLYYITTSSQSISIPGRVLLANDDRLCDEVAEISEDAALVGSVSAWLSGALYFTARFPQIWTNYQRKATEGLSLAMFASSTAANILYTLSIVIPKSTWSMDSSQFYENTFPYLLGSGGTILSTIPILVQFYYYRKTDSGYYYVEHNNFESSELDIEES